MITLAPTQDWQLGFALPCSDRGVVTSAWALPEFAGHVSADAAVALRDRVAMTDDVFITPGHPAWRPPEE